MGRELLIPNDKVNELVDKANKQNKMVDIAFSAYPSHSSQKDLHGNALDIRDLTDLALSFELIDGTPQEQQEDLNRQVKEMVDAFQNHDETKMKVYLDKMYDLLESTSSFLDHEITDEKEFNKMISCARLNQAYATKRNENPDFILKRFDTPEKRLQKCSNISLNNELCVALQDFKDAKAPTLIHKQMNSTMLVNLMGLNYVQNFDLCLQTALNNESREMLFDLPTRIITDVNGSRNDITATTFEGANADNDIQLTFARFVGENKDNRFLGTHDFSFVFIGDKSIEDLAREELLKEDEFHGNPRFIKEGDVLHQGEMIFRKALLKGENVISYVMPGYNYKEGKIENTIVKIKPNMEKLKNDLTNEGKIEEANNLPTQDEVNKLYENASDLNEVLNNKMNTFLEGKKYEYYDVENPAKNEVKFKNEDIINEGIAKFDENFKLAEEAQKAAGINNTNTRSFDTRDLKFMAMLFDVKGNTLEEKQQDMNKQFKEMADAFTGDDPTKKEKYLEMLWTSFEKSTLGLKREVQTADEVRLLICSSQLVQAINTKAQENKDYFFKRFDDTKQYEKFVAQKLCHETLDIEVKKMYESHPHENKLSFLVTPDAFVEERELFKQFAVKRLYAAEHSKKIIELNIPQGYKDLSEGALNDKVGQLIASVSEQENNALLMREKYGTKLMEEREYRNKTFFLNDQSVESLAIKELRKTKEYKDKSKKISTNALINKSIELVKNALMKGDKAVSYVSNNKSRKYTDTDLIKIKPNLKAIRDAEMSKHSWFRKTFFDWGPFKIDAPLDQKKIDEIYKKDYKKAIIAKAEGSLTHYAGIKKELEIASDLKLEQIQSQREKNKELLVENKEINTTEDLRKSIVEEEKKDDLIISTSKKVEEPEVKVEKNIENPKVD